MKRDIIEALDISIDKWSAIANGTGSDHGPSDCGLCLMFYDGGCEGCPIFEQTKKRLCAKTPYRDWDNSNIWYARTYEGRKNPAKGACGGWVANTERRRKIASDMRDLLVSLLPMRVPSFAPSFISKSKHINMKSQWRNQRIAELEAQIFELKKKGA